MMSEDMAVSFTRLRTMSGFTNEELQGIARLQLGTSKTTDEITKLLIALFAKVSCQSIKGKKKSFLQAPMQP